MTAQAMIAQAMTGRHVQAMTNLVTTGHRVLVMVGRTIPATITLIMAVPATLVG